jgi:hypothetical protein
MTRGTEKRQRNHVLKARFNDLEAAAIREMADRSGLSVGSLIRHATLNAPPPRRARPRPQVEIQTLVRVLGELGKIGSNINQYAKSRNMGRESDSLDLAMEAACRDLLELRLPLMQAIGQEPARGKVFEPDDPANEPTLSF